MFIRAIKAVGVGDKRRHKQEPLERKLYPGMASSGEPKVDMTADQYARFEEMHGGDQMAVDKLQVRLLRT